MTPYLKNHDDNRKEENPMNNFVYSSSSLTNTKYSTPLHQQNKVNIIPDYKIKNLPHVMVKVPLHGNKTIPVLPNFLILHM